MENAQTICLNCHYLKLLSTIIPTTNSIKKKTTTRMPRKGSKTKTSAVDYKDVKFNIREPTSFEEKKDVKGSNKLSEEDQSSLQQKRKESEMHPENI
ncbi:hypothetical protein ABK040_002490 [Willaertia magna]